MGIIKNQQNNQIFINMKNNKNMQNNILKGGSLTILVFSVLIISSFALPGMASAMSASCSANPSTASAGQQVTFTSNVPGNWSGDCTGTGTSCSATFGSLGVKTANLQVVSGGQMQVVSCSVTVNQVTPNPTPNPNPNPAVQNISASCSANPSTATVGDNVTFTSNVPGTWSGACTGTGTSCSTSFGSLGAKTANLQVISGGQMQNVQCTVLVNQVSGNGTNNGGSNNSGLHCVGNNAYNGQTLVDSCGLSRTCQNGACVSNNGTNNNGSNSNPVNDPSVSCYVNQSLTPAPVTTGQTVIFSSNVSGTWSGDCTGTGSSCSKSFASAGNYSATFKYVSGNQMQVVICPRITVNQQGGNNYIAHSYLQCSGNNVYWFDSNGSINDIYQSCGLSQTCQNNTCTGNGNNNGNNYIAHSYLQCSGNNVYWFDSNGSINGLYQSCGLSQTCQNNTCTGNYNYNNNNYNYNNYIAHSYLQCSGNSVYWYDSNGSINGLYQSCGLSQYCSGNSCTGNYNNYNNNNYNSYVSHSYQQCSGNSVYWYDSNGTRQDVSQICGYNQSCSGNACVTNYNYNNYNYSNYTTYNNNAYTQCYNGDLYWYSSNGIVQGLYKSCASNVSAGGYSNYCVGNSVYQKPVSYSSGCANNACYSLPLTYNYTFGSQFVKTCGYNQTCSAGACVTTVKPTTYVYHYIKKCDAASNNVYWYDSANFKQDLYKTCDSTQTCTDADCVAKPVSQISGLALTIFGKSEASGSQWAKNISVGGNQSLDFLAVVSNGSDQTMENVVVTVSLPREILYKDNVTVDGTPYSGDITAGIQLGNLAPKSTKAIAFTSVTSDEANFMEGVATATSTVTTSGGSSTDSVQINLVKGLQVQQQQTQPTSPTSSGFLASLFGAGSGSWLYILLAIIIIILIIVAVRRFNENQKQ